MRDKDSRPNQGRIFVKYPHMSIFMKYIPGVYYVFVILNQVLTRNKNH